MKSNEIVEIGERLRASDIRTISTGDIYTLLRKATNTLGVEPLKKYLRVLRDDGYIRFTQQGLWEIIHEIKEKKEGKDKPIETVDELDEKILEIKSAKIINPMTEQQRVKEKKDELRYRQQIALLIKELEENAKKKKTESMHRGGIYVIWIDSYEYHVVCEDCYKNSGVKYFRTGNASIDDILSKNPKECEYCGAKLEESIP